MDKTEIPVIEWVFYCQYIYNQYGEDSPEMKKALPDTLLFQQVYGFPFLLSRTSNNKEEDLIRTKQSNLPMTCVSYQQILDFCQWRADRVNERWQLEKKPYTVSYSLPSKEDYNKAMQNAIISQNQSISPLLLKKKFTGLTDNVAEFTEDENVIVEGGSNNIIIFVKNTSIPVGFRCKAIIQEK